MVRIIEVDPNRIRRSAACVQATKTIDPGLDLGAVHNGESIQCE